MTAIEVIPAGIQVGTSHTDSDGNDLDQLWADLGRADWSSSAAAYITALAARRIIEQTGMTHKAFAAECRQRHIAGFGSQGSVSRRLRWAEMHDDLWAAGILPAQVFIPEAASRPLFDGKLTKRQRLELLAELFGPYMTDEQRRAFAESLTEAMMREQVNRTYGTAGTYKAPRRLLLEPIIARLIKQGHSADEIAETAYRLADSGRNTPFDDDPMVTVIHGPSH